MALERLNENATNLANIIEQQLRQNSAEISAVFAEHIGTGEVRLETTPTRLVFDPRTEDLTINGGTQTLVVKPLEVQQKEAAVRAQERQLELQALQQQEELRLQADTQIQLQASAHAERMGQLATGHTHRMREIQTKHDKEEAKIQNEYKDKLAVHNRLHQEDLCQLKEKREKAMREHEGAIQAKRAEIDRLARANQGRSAALHQEHLRQQQAAEEELRKLQNSLSQLRTQANNEVNAAQARYQQA